MAKKRKTRGREPKDRKPKKQVLGGAGKKPAPRGRRQVVRAGAKSSKRSGESRGKSSGVRKRPGLGAGGVRQGRTGGSRKTDSPRKKNLRRRPDAPKSKKKVVKGKAKTPVRKIRRAVPPKKPSRKTPKKPQRKLPKKPLRKLPKRPVRKQPKKLPRKPVRKQPKEPKRKKPRKIPEKPAKPVLALPSASVEAERRIQNILIEAMQEGARRIPDLSIGVKSFVNADRTVDGEITFSNIPSEWREKEGLPFMAEFLSEVLQAIGVLTPGDEAGGYYITAGCRFGPRDESEMAELAEMYKRFRGLLQISSHYTSGQARDAIQNQVAALRDMIRLLMEKRGTPPVTILVRFTWTPDGKRPERFEGEKGSG